MVQPPQGPTSVIFVFLDGVGLGSDVPGINPLVDPDVPFFGRVACWTKDALRSHAPGFELVGLDANLDVPGLPQSGTGQATLFTGVNCARRAGRHFGPFPHSTSRPILSEHNIFRQIAMTSGDIDGECAFANAYPDRFFDRHSETGRWTVTTRCCIESGVRIRSTNEIRAGLAVAADITGSGLRRFGIDVPVVTEVEAADVLLSIAASRRFTLFEYFLTDKAGHAQDAVLARSSLTSVGRFLERICDGLTVDRQLLIVTSDHGNLEDLSTRVHTRNPVPLLAYGKGAGHIDELRSIEDVTPAIVRQLADGAGP